MPNILGPQHASACFILIKYTGRSYNRRAIQYKHSLQQKSQQNKPYRLCKGLFVEISLCGYKIISNYNDVFIYNLLRFFDT